MIDLVTAFPGMCKRIGIAADHGGFELKEQLAKSSLEAGYAVVDFGAPGHAATTTRRPCDIILLL